MKKIMLILICIFCFLTSVYAEESKEEKNETTQNNSSENSTTDLTPNAKSAIMVEASTGEIIYEKNSNEELPMASMTNIMTT